MKRKTVFFYYGQKEKNSNYAHIIMSEAIKAKMMMMHMGPDFLYNERWLNIHNKICMKYKFLPRLFYRLYLPAKLNRKEKYIFMFNQWHPILLNIEFIKWLKTNYDVKTVLLIWNMIPNKRIPVVNGLEVGRLKQIHDLIVTCER